LIGWWLCQTSAALWAESGVLLVHVEDVQGRPISGLQIGVKGDGGSKVTGNDGEARIPLAKQTREGHPVSLQILSSPPGKDFVMISPWDRETIVPSFENESKNFVNVVVVRPGDRTALLNGTFLAAATAQISKANAPKTGARRPPKEDPMANLALVAAQYGLNPDDLDKAIRSWGETTTDPYQAGLAALYRRKYREASAQLKESLQNREAKLATDQTAVADAAFFLGQSLSWEGKYRESAAAFHRYLEFKPNDVSALSSLGLSLTEAGDYAEAEPLLQRALAIVESLPDPNYSLLAIVLGNFGGLLEDKGDYAGAEPLFRQALAIRERTLGSENPGTGESQNNLALLLQDKGDYAGAEPLFRRALANAERSLGPDDPSVAAGLNNLAALLRSKGDFGGSEPLFLRALAIVEKALGSDHPLLAEVLGNFGGLLEDKGDYAGAEPLFRSALSITEKTVGPDHPDTAECLNNLGELLSVKGDYDNAEPLFRRALVIVEKSKGPDHPNVAAILNNLALLLQAKHSYTGAEPLFRRALTIREKTFGLDHPDTVQSLCNLAALLHDEGDYDEAEVLVQRALAAGEKTFGPEHPRTKQISRVLQIWLKEETLKKTER
jgi:tetratricopeptide (TPR) repeat protein